MMRCVPGTDLRLFGKPELRQASHGRGAGADDVDTARAANAGVRGKGAAAPGLSIKSGLWRLC